jgi:hypothetical protein
MDMTWISELTPEKIIIIFAGVFAFILLAKYTGLSVGKKGLYFEKTEKLTSIHDMVSEIDVLNRRQEEKIDSLCASDQRQEKKLDNLSSAVTNNTKDILRITFYNNTLSPAERLVAGKRYLAAGGNGETEKAVKELAAQYPEAWKAICIEAIKNGGVE